MQAVAVGRGGKENLTKLEQCEVRLGAVRFRPQLPSPRFRAEAAKAGPL